MSGEAQGGREVFLCKDLARRCVITLFRRVYMYVHIVFFFFAFSGSNITVQFVVELAREM